MEAIFLLAVLECQLVYYDKSKYFLLTQARDVINCDTPRIVPLDKYKIWDSKAGHSQRVFL